MPASPRLFSSSLMFSLKRIDLTAEIGQTSRAEFALGRRATSANDILIRLADYRPKPGRVFFDRQELRKILNLYSTRVARGEWRDYAIDLGDHGVAFSVFRHSRDWPLYVIAKLAPGRHRAGGYVVSAGAQTLSRGRSIDDVLAALERELEPA